MNLLGWQIHLIPVYYRSKGENVHYYTFITIQFTDFVWCNHSWLFIKFYYDDPNKENKYNNVSNQQDATTFTFINLLNQTYMFRATNSLILRSTFRLYIQLWVQCTDTAADLSAAVSVHCTQSCIYSLKVLLRMSEFVARNM